MSTLLRQHAEQQFAEELHELKRTRPTRFPKLGDVTPIRGHLPHGRDTEERF